VVTWVRGPWWDSFWFLSAPLLGLLMLVPLVAPLPTAEITAGIIVLRFAHAISSIILAWSHHGYRQVMLANRPKFIGVPALVMLLGLAIGIGTAVLFPTFKPVKMSLENLQLRNLDIPIVIWANIYAVWNLYHGGMQDFGFLCLYRRRGFKGWQKFLVAAACVAAIVFGVHLLPGLLAIKSVVLFLFGFVTVNHYLAAIGLSAHIHARHFRCSPMAFVGGSLFVAIWLTFAFFIAMDHSIPWFDVALSLSLALGIWHFLQDRWTFRFSDPQVRATIGRDLRGPTVVAT
jgi:hypothetical protein